MDGGDIPDDGAPLELELPGALLKHRCSAGTRRPRSTSLARRARAGPVLAQRHQGAAEQAAVSEYADWYFNFRAANNVLGPSRLFFSTYLESIWLDD